jgi:CubicO group peptidase (beta-lactamase class C family)
MRTSTTFPTKLMSSEEDENVIIRRLAHLRPSAGIRQVMQYNNMHYWVIGEIVARLSKIPFHEYVKTHILDPVGMVSTTFNHTFAAETGNRSEPFVNSNINSSKCVEIWERDDELDKSCYGDSFSTAWHVKGDGLFMAAVGGLFSSTSDIVR